MIIDRDLFIKLFNNIDTFLIDYYDFENEKIKIWLWEEEYFILEKETGILVSWYKHLGRCNKCNKNMSLEDLKNFVLVVEEELINEISM